MSYPQDMLRPTKAVQFPSNFFVPAWWFVFALFVFSLTNSGTSIKRRWAPSGTHH
jgi:hypothetical protein